MLEVLSEHNAMKQIVAILILLCSLSLRAATYTAASASWTDVSNAVALASSGDTVNVPAGSVTWTGTLQVIGSIKLIAAGIGQTVITDEVPRVGGDCSMIVWSVNAGDWPRLSGFTFVGGVTNTGGTSGIIRFNGSCSAFRFDHVRFQQPQNTPLSIFGTVYGVIDHCDFWLNTSFVNCIDYHQTANGDNYGDLSWSTPVLWGTTNALYMEDNTGFYYTAAGGGLQDMYQGARMVVRYNTVTNLYVQNHGTENGGGWRGGRSIEVYKNRFTDTSGVNTTPFFWRSGNGVYFSNLVDGGSWNIGAIVANYRENAPYTPWGQADGVNAWDSNSPTVYASGTHTGGNGTSILVDSTKTWTVNQWVGYTVRNITAGSAKTISANDATSLTTTYDASGHYMSFNTGDSYDIRLVLGVLDGIGRGSGDLVIRTNGGPINSVSGTASWPNEPIEPLYFWNNTFMGDVNHVYWTYQWETVVANRDITNGVMPGYTSLVYPHPLVTTNSTPPVVTNPLYLPIYRTN